MYAKGVQGGGQELREAGRVKGFGACASEGLRVSGSVAFFSHKLPWDFLRDNGNTLQHPYHGFPHAGTHFVRFVGQGGNADFAQFA